MFTEQRLDDLVVFEKLGIKARMAPVCRPRPLRPNKGSVLGKNAPTFNRLNVAKASSNSFFVSGIYNMKGQSQGLSTTFASSIWISARVPFASSATLET
jgi:hypothetical protein